MKRNWNEITVNEFIQLEQLLKSDIPESYRTANVIALLDNKTIEEVENLPITEFMKLSKQLDFITEQPTYNDPENEYEINGRIYTLKADITQITTAQYIDYQNYMKEENKDISKLLSVWLIPKGHKYGEDYDMGEVIKDCGDMNLPDALGISFFFPKQLAAYILISKDYLSKNLSILNQPSHKIKELETSLNSMALSLWSLPFQRKP